MRAILALDLGLHTGWALYNTTEGITFGTQDFSIKKRKVMPPRCSSFMEFSKWLDNLLYYHKVTEVYYEEVMRHSGTRAAHVYGAFECLMEIGCHVHKIKPIGVQVKTIKMFATNNGNASKEAMVAAAIKFGMHVTDDNQADALHLLRYKLYGREG